MQKTAREFSGRPRSVNWSGDLGSTGVETRPYSLFGRIFETRSRRFHSDRRTHFTSLHQLRPRVHRRHQSITGGQKGVNLARDFERRVV